jgi:hypothetical protein
VLWEMLTGQGLFEGDSIYAIARAVEHQQIRPPSQVLGAPLPLGLDAAVMNALDRDPARRTPTAAAFAEELEQVVQTAGDETLEAWAARVLAEPRNVHRAWLANVVAGKDAPRSIGRPTGAVTALGPQLARAPTMVAPVAPAALPTTEPPPDPQASTHLTAVTEEEAEDLGRRPRRSLVLPIVLGLVVLALVGGLFFFAHHASEPRDRLDAGILELPVDARSPTDASAPDGRAVDAEVVDAEAPADAPADAPIDAGHRRPVRPLLDAGRPLTRDAMVSAAAIDAPQAQGLGALTAKHRGDRYLNVVVDGHIVGPTPMFNEPIAAGTHVVELVDPNTSKVVIRRAVTVDAGKTAIVVEP